MGLLEKYTDRIEEMQLGVRELENWLLDTVEQGLAQIPSLSPEVFEEVASRLVDLKLGSIARRIRGLEKSRHDEDWRIQTTSLITELYYFVRRFQKIHDLPSDQQFDLLQQGGVNIKKNDVAEQGEAIEDYWMVLGLELGMEEQLRYRRTWLWGEDLQQAALILDFAWGGESFEGHFVVGTAMEAQLTYYPGTVHKSRAILRDVHPKDRPFARLDGQDSLEAFTLHYADALAHSPELINYPVLLNEVICFAKEGRFYLADQEGYYLPLKMLDFTAWQLVAMSAGHPVTVFATFDGTSLRPLSAVVNKRVVNLISN